jgi:hypothetical protein
MLFRLIGKTFALILNIHWIRGNGKHQQTANNSRFGRHQSANPPSRGRLQVSMALHRKREKQRRPIVKWREKRKTLFIQYERRPGAKQVQVRRTRSVAACKCTDLAQNQQPALPHTNSGRQSRETSPRVLPFKVRRFK